MNYIKIVLGIIFGLVVITLIAESIEFTIVSLVSGKSLGQLQANQDIYFNIRNRNWILISKIFYSLFAGIAGGYFATWISGKISKITIFALIFVQIISLVWGGFFSEWSSTGPIWMWLYLLTIIPFGIWVGYRWKKNPAR